MNRTSPFLDCSLGLIAGALAVITIQSYAPVIFSTASTAFAPLIRHRSIVRAAWLMLGGVTATVGVGRWAVLTIFERGN